MVDLSKVFQPLTVLATALFGGYGFKEIIKGKNERMKDVRETRLRIIQDFNWLINRLDSSAYGLIGDFREHMHFLTVSKYLNKDLIKKITEWIPSQDLPSDSSQALREAQSKSYEAIVLELKKASVSLEAEWISNPRGKFSRLRRKLSSNKPR